MDTKKRFKMYKAGKKWCYAAVATISVAFGMAISTNAQADVNTSAITPSTTVVSNSSNTTQTTTEQSQVTANQWNNVSGEDHGYLDSVDTSNANTIQVSGWHANDKSQLANNHYVILYDNTAKQQVASNQVTTTQRQDVKNAYSNMATSANSGFSTSFSTTGLQKGHNYSVVSRYSTSNEGNGNDGFHADNWLGNITFNDAKYNIDSIEQTSNGIHVTGWMADDAQLNGYKNAYIILLHNGTEISRQNVKLTQRQDVAKVYPKLTGSLNSGFDTTFYVDASQLSGDLQFVLRFTSSADGNSNYRDQFSQKYSTNAGYVDNATINGSTLHLTGWHAATAANNNQHEFIIVTDLSGHELYRTELTNSQKNISRNDVARVYPWIANANKSGFSVDIPLSDAMQHKQIRVYHRLSSSADGNSNYVDMVSTQSINSGWQGKSYYDPTTGQKVTGTVTIDGKQYTFDGNGVLQERQANAVNKALSVKGTPYVWGGNRPGGFDCSGLVQWAYGLGGNYRTTYQQTSLGAHHRDVYNAPLGALVFFGSDSAPYHVGISLGNGSYVHASTPGDVVKVTQMRWYTPSYYIAM